MSKFIMMLSERERLRVMGRSIMLSERERLRVMDRGMREIKT